MVPAPNNNAFCLIDSAKELRQGEIISDLKYYNIVPNKEDPNKSDVQTLITPFAILGTPDCDLFQDFRDNAENYVDGAKLPNVIIFLADAEDAGRKRANIVSKEWRLVKKNKVDQFYYIAENNIADSLEGTIPPLLVDFKRYVSLTPAEILRQCNAARPAPHAQRRCRLSDLWREDFQRKAMSFMQRVGLPAADDDDQ